MTMTLRSTSRRWLVPIGLVLLIGGLALPAARVAAGTQHVTSCADDGGATTLRGRIGTAATGDTILFDQNCTITLTAASGALTLTQGVTIDGIGHTVIVDGNNAVRVFAVNSGVTASLNNLTIQHGSTQSLNPGGGIFNLGTLAATNSTIANNTASLIGAGIANLGTMTVTNCTIANNTVSDQQLLTFYLKGGGGIYNNSGTLTVASSILSGNHTGHLEDGGGIKSDGGTLTVTNSTFSGNTAFHGGGLDLVNIYRQGGTKTVTNTIVAGNQPPGHHEVNGGVTSGGHNLIGDADGSTGWGSSDLTGTDASPLNPLLGPLGNYGGRTQTFPLLPGSLAIGGGATGAGIPTTDQRGVARTGHNDIGAFQSQGFTLPRTSGSLQSQQTNAPFLMPLALTVTANAAGAPYNEPMQGGTLLIFTPLAAGASAILSGNPDSLPANGQVSLNATANGTAGGRTSSPSVPAARIPLPSRSPTSPRPHTAPTPLARTPITRGG